MFCKKYKAEIPERSKYCPKCGTRIVKEAAGEKQEKKRLGRKVLIGLPVIVFVAAAVFLFLRMAGSGQNLSGESTAAAGTPESADPITLTADEMYFFAGETGNVVFAAEGEIGAEGIALYQGAEEEVALMNDEGRNGDAQAGDGIYSCTLAADGLAGSREYFAKSAGQESNTVGIYIFEQPTEENAAGMREVCEAVEADLLDLEEAYKNADGYVPEDDYETMTDDMLQCPAQYQDRFAYVRPEQFVLTNEQLAEIASALNVPEELARSFRQSEPSLWEVGDRYLTFVKILRDGVVVASASVDSYTGEIVRNVSAYNDAGTTGTAGGTEAYDAVIASYTQWLNGEISLYQLDESYTYGFMEYGIYDAGFFTDDQGFRVWQGEGNSFAYTTIDVNLDGTPELLVAYGSGYGNYELKDLWTLVDGAPAFACYGDSRFQYQPTTDGRLALVWNSGAENYRMDMYTVDSSGQLIPGETIFREGEAYYRNDVNISAEEFESAYAELQSLFLDISGLAWTTLAENPA